MKTQRGFSLIELLVVVVIIGVIAAVAVPGLQRARRYAQSGSAIQSLRTITTAENLYERRHRTYATLADLLAEEFVDTNIGFGFKSGYQLSLSLVLDANDTAIGKLLTFKCTADPDQDSAIGRYFYVDETAVIRQNEGARASVASDPIPK